MRSVSILLVIVVAGLVSSGAAFGKEKDVQHHEISAAIDLNVVSLGNEALFDLQYRWSPAGIDRNEEAPPELRRFLLHPFSLFIDIQHNGGTREAITTAEAGGEIFPLNGLIYAKASGGVGRHLTIYDEPFEFGWYFATAYGEAGFRPVGSLQLGAFYRVSPILKEDLDDKTIANNQAQRSGQEQMFGGIVTFSTPNDRLFATIKAFGVVNDYHFKNTGDFSYPGDETVRGFGLGARVAYLASLTTTFQISANIERDHRVDGRANEALHLGIAPDSLDLDRNLWTFEGTADFIFWYTGRYAFRLSVGGGYRQVPQQLLDGSINLGVLARPTALLKLGGGVLMRF